jgi:hypothetical protein
MANLSAFQTKALLDWSFGGATPTRPTQWWMNLSLGSPTNVTASEMSTGSGITRQTLAMPAASTAAATNSSGTVMNTANATFGPLSGASNSFSGIIIFGATSNSESVSGAGTQWWQGLLATVRSAIIGDSLVISSSALTALMG